ncbi:MAG: ABC transporter substrate-binding protein [Clostridia bacterium]|nr:ABC transporter substrate-binding protein [Clostridia bacterium]
MSAKIMNSHRYKKTTRKKADASKERIKKSVKYKKETLKANREKNKIEIKDSYIKLNNSNNANKLKESKKKQIKKHDFTNVFKVLGLVACIALIALLSRVIVKKENEPIVQADFNPKQKVTLMQDYDFKIGMSKLDTIDYLKSKNMILNELVSQTSNRLISVNKDYSIEYIVAKNIEKINNKQYFIELNQEYNIKPQDVINKINEMKMAGKDNIYYSKISNISNVEAQGNNALTISLKEEDPYFVYELSFPFVNIGNDFPYRMNNANNNSVLFTRKKSSSTLKSISFTGYNDIDNLIDDFKNSKIDMFTASSDSIMQLIGKYEYNVKKYRDGQTIFLFGNKESKIFNQKEVRQALVYSLNREEMVKKINASFSEVIDLPFIYSNIRYKYDIVGARNILIQQGWTNDKGMYKKKVNEEVLTLQLTLLVNEKDQTKVQIADMMKDMAENVGIRINIRKAKDQELQELIKKKAYDIILADVYSNDNPDITYLEEYLNINEKTNSALQIVKESKVVDLPKNIVSLQDVLSDEIACIGILARNTNVVYQKNINGFEDINYMKVLYNLNYIGKIQSIEKDSE